MNKDTKILVVGHGDIIERSLVEHLRSQGFDSVISSTEIALNTTVQPSVYNFFSKEKPEYVFLASVASGGIEVNQKYPAEFLYSNLESQNNVIYAACKFSAKKLLFFGASCVYAKTSPQPMREEYILQQGPLEETSEPYSVAKIAGIKLCQAYKKQYGFDAIVGIPATVYGPESDFDGEGTHVIAALISKFYQATAQKKDQVVVWGTGEPRREFLYRDDFVNASVFLMESYKDSMPVNIGCGQDIPIKELADVLKDISGFEGEIVFDATKPDGAPKKLLDNTRLTSLGWRTRVSLEDGIKKTYQWYVESKETESQK